MHSLRFKITAITIAAILTTVLCVFIASRSALQSGNDQNSVEMMNLIGQNTKKSVEQYTESVEQTIKTLSHIAADLLDPVVLAENGAIGQDPDRTGRTTEQQETLDAYLKQHCARVEENFTGFAAHTHGVIGYYYCINPDISEKEHGFFYSKAGKTGFVAQEPLNAADLDPEDALHNIWYFTTVKRGRPSWIDPYKSLYSDLWLVSYTIPIYKSGTLIGVVGMDMPIETMVKQVSSIRVYQTGFASLVDADGHILYHPELEPGTQVDFSDYSISEEMLKRGDSGDTLLRYTRNGEERLLSFCTLVNDMKLFVVAPVGEINAVWSRVARNDTIVTLFIILVFVILSLLIMSYITRPLRQLTDASRRLADADYNVELDYKGKNEIGSLTEAFNRMRDQIRHYIDDLNHQIYTDKLTGLPNMRHFFRLAKAEKERLLGENKDPAMLYFDIIGMKNVNRQYGFETGDRLICRFAELLSRQFGEDKVCRFSGDHFAAVASEDHAEEQIRALFLECEKAGTERGLAVRAGIYPYRLEDTDVSTACDRAKHACDMNRGALTSCFSVYDEEMLKTVEIYRHIVHNIDKALSENWIQVYYQPIVRTANNKVCDEEALSRWIDPVKGFLSPTVFIPALEESRQIHKLDLYVLEQILAKLKRQEEEGLYLVPQSVNLSRVDFDSCDIVEEIRSRVDAAGMARSLITIEITESVIGSDFDFMKQQVLRFQELGFQVWMDDFGSGYSSLDVLKNIRFDLLKFDMRFMDGFDEGDEGKVILSELAKMALGLGVESICEGVEKEEQVEFLREIGVTKIQGYYYGKPIPFEEILSKYGENIRGMLENPEETEYYTSIGRINLYDMGILKTEDDNSMQRYFDTLPMCIMEVNGERLKYNRCNKSYRDFLERTLGIGFTTQILDYRDKRDEPGWTFMTAVMRCSRDGNAVVVDERVNDDTTIHTFVRRVAQNPVTGTIAVAAAVLAVIKDGENAGTNYSNIAKALSADYVDLYYVNLDTETFTEYSPDATREDLTLERHGNDFFAASRRDALRHLYKDDQEFFVSSFTKENVRNMLDTQGTFTLNYRLMMNGSPVYVNLKAVRMQGDPTHIIIGVNNIDAQMRQKEALARIQEEQTTYSRINALISGFLCIYTVDPVTSRFTEYAANNDYEGLGVPKEGDDFFASTVKQSVKHIYPDDLAMFQELFTKEKVLEEVEKHGIYSLSYRILLGEEPIYVSIKGAMVEEQDGPHLIIGLSNIDSQVRQEQDYERKLLEVRTEAHRDRLTGVKDKEAYESMSATLARQIKGGQMVQYAIVLCSVNDLKNVNETQGREAGDQLIRDACHIVCNVFKHSPVFRVTGDEFAVLAEGHDYEWIDRLVEKLGEMSDENHIAISCGMARYDGMESVASVFARAERLCKEKCCNSTIPRKGGN